MSCARADGASCTSVHLDITHFMVGLKHWYNLVNSPAPLYLNGYLCVIFSLTLVTIIHAIFCSWTSANIEDIPMHSIATHQVKESSTFTVRELLSHENTGKYGYQSKHFDVTIAESKMNVMQNLIPLLSHELENGKNTLEKKKKKKGLACSCLWALCLI